MPNYTAWIIRQVGTRLACDHLTFLLVSYTPSIDIRHIHCSYR